MTPFGIILILFFTAVSIAVTYFVIKFAVVNAILEAQRTGDSHKGLDRIIKRAVAEVLEERGAK